MGEEIVVLIHRKNREIDHNIGYHNGFLTPLGRCFLNTKTAEEREDSGDGNQDQETPRPPAVEDIAGQNDEEVLPKKLARTRTQHIAKNEPIEQKDDWQENGICERIEKHAAEILRAKVHIFLCISKFITSFACGYTFFFVILSANSK
jgi:hypothetical protein